MLVNRLQRLFRNIRAKLFKGFIQFRRSVPNDIQERLDSAHHYERVPDAAALEEIPRDLRRRLLPKASHSQNSSIRTRRDRGFGVDPAEIGRRMFRSRSQ